MRECIVRNFCPEMLLGCAILKREKMQFLGHSYLGTPARLPDFLFNG